MLKIPGLNHTIYHRPRKVFESGGVGESNWVEDEGCARSEYRRGSPPTTGIQGFIPRKFWKFYIQNGPFCGKIAVCFDYKQTAILTHTFGHKCFSEVE